KFRFCGSLEPPDWLLAELPLLASLTRDCDLVALCEEISDAIASQEGVERVAALLPDLGDAKAVVAVLRFVLRHAAKYNVSSADLVLELQQLGLEMVVVDAVTQVFAAKRAQIRAQLARESFEFPHIQKTDWRVRPASSETNASPEVAVDLNFELDRPALECAMRPAGGAKREAGGGGGASSLLELTMDKDKFLALYDDLLQAQALLQSTASSPLGHWTKALTGENATTKLGARFHLRKLFLREDTFSQDELEYMIQYLVHETTIQEQLWWKALSHFERLEIVSRLKLHHVRKDEEQTLWFSRHEATRDCILLYGSAEAKSVDASAAPLLSFPEGSVVGNLALPQGVLPPQNSEPSSLEALASSGSTNWRRVKRERQFREAQEFYNKLAITGPADYLLLTSSDVVETISRAADRVEQDKWVRAFGLERVFETGALIATEDELLGSMYIIMNGECRASVRCSGVGARAPTKTTAEEMVTHTHKLRSRTADQLPIASLGPLSTVGDISVVLGVLEPATVQATTTVTTLWLSLDDFTKECGDVRDPGVLSTIAIAGKSLGGSPSLANQGERFDPNSYYEESDRLKLQRDSSLDSMVASAVFLFPTMTRQRQLHS
ncbi:hypothetical protein PybrP1_010890, partial [[Pythium] brassicae (nom. inval.)]